MPILGSRIPVVGRTKTTMSNNKTIMGSNKVVSFEEVAKETAPLLQPSFFSKGFYHWVMFLLSLYTRIRENLKIDFESFVVLQVVVSHALYELNKTGTKSFSELELQMTDIRQRKYRKNSKLTYASIAEVLQLPRETVRRKVMGLCKMTILTFNSSDGIKLGPAYKTIYKEFVTQTTLDLSSLLKKWKHMGALDAFFNIGK